MMYAAFVTDKKTKQKLFIRSDYKTKKAFTEDIKANGYRLHFICKDNETDLNKESEKYHARLEKQRRQRAERKITQMEKFIEMLRGNKPYLK